MSVVRAGLICVMVSACGLTSVEAPDIIQPGDYANAAGATALAAGAITAFHQSFGSGQTGNQVAFSGLMADELLIASTNTFAEPWDNRVDNDGLRFSDLPYATIQDTRQRLLSAIASFEQVAPDSAPRIGQLFALLGYTSVFLAENYCAGVPLSHRDKDLFPVYGQPLTTAQLLDSAIAAFDSALVHGVDSARILNLARVGRGRALLNQGRFADAAAAVTAVPSAYVYNVTYVATTLESYFFRSTSNPAYTTIVTVPEREGTNGINWRTANDPRVTLIRRAPAGTAPEVYGFVPYQAANAAIRLAGGTEARLIEAEAALNAGNNAAWLSALNALRAGTAGLAPLTDPGPAAGRVDLHFRERAFWLFLTGHRHGDLRRLVRQYGRATESVFPTGAWLNGVQYGPATSMAPPPTESANPHFTGCLNNDA